MQQPIAAKLREHGRIVRKGQNGLVSIGIACRKRIASKEHEAARRRRRDRDDAEFARKYGGRDRRPFLEERFADIFERHPDWDRKYFESRAWEKEVALAS